MLTRSSGRFSDQAAHRIHNDRGGTTVDTTAERYEVSLSSGSSEVIPEPARRSKSVIGRQSSHYSRNGNRDRRNFLFRSVEMGFV